MKYLALTILHLCMALAASGAEHRFYAVESEGDSIAEGIESTVHVDKRGNVETVTLCLRNTRHTPFQPVKAGLKLGVDTYMDTYPEWYGKFFPTLAVCEPDHFYGYMQSPEGKVKAVVCADPIASWSLDYNLGYQDPWPHWFWGHRIECLNLDMLCRGPLPDHNPRLWKLEPGEERTWTVKLIDLDGADNFEETVHRYTGAPVIAMERTSCAPGDLITVDILGHAPEVDIEGKNIGLKKVGTDRWRGTYRANDAGIKNIEVVDGEREAHGTLVVRHPWRKTMSLARRAVQRYKQKPTSHVESWYGFHTAFDAARIMPEPGIDSVLNKRFGMIVGKVFDLETGEPQEWKWRIQNVSSTIGMLADRYLVYGNTADLDFGERLADYLIGCQRGDGAYMNGNTDYTSVIYPAKSLLEFADAERAAGRKKQAARIEKSARRAIERLAEVDGNLETEGQLTYEDGMVSCSALQLGELALRSKNPNDRKRLTDAMLKLLDGHDCLTQLRVPDGRRRGGTMRFWEAQYDVFMLPNMISSPHGWSAWRAYATYYAYLLTGEERWLRETFDAASAFAALLDHRTGDLSWAFVVDPYVRARQVSEPDTNHSADDDTYGNPHPELYPNREIIIGEQYMPMIADWQTIVSSDNDVHECFKFIAEAVLCNAFIIERPDGSIAAYNCRVNRQDNTLHVKANEPQMTTLYTNLHTPYKVNFGGDIKKVHLITDKNTIKVSQHSPEEIGEVISFIKAHMGHTVKEGKKDTLGYIALPKPYSVPSMLGNFHQDMFYWDTYFTNIGLLRDSDFGQALNNVDNILFLIEKFGFMPNGSNVMFLNRSQPPFASMMVRDIYERSGDKAWLASACKTLEKEYAFWMTKRMTPTGLNRHSNSATKEELVSFYEYMRSRFTDLPALTDSAELFKQSSHLIAEAESGWDFSPRFDFRCEDFIPVDLNANLYLYEKNFAWFYKELKKKGSDKWLKAAEKRKRLLNKYCYNPQDGCFYDYDFVNDKLSPVYSSAVFNLLWAGALTKKQAGNVVTNLQRLEYPGGIVACEAGKRTRTYQWDFPNAWASFNVLSIDGLDRYGFKEDARRIARKYVDSIVGIYQSSGNLWEKFNGEQGNLEVNSEYDLPPFLGWTAGAFIYASDYLMNN